MGLDLPRFCHDLQDLRLEPQQRPRSTETPRRLNRWRGVFMTGADRKVELLLQFSCSKAPCRKGEAAAKRAASILPY